MSGRRLDSYDMHEAKRATEIRNSRIKRGEGDHKHGPRTQHVACGCGVKGCVFISDAWAEKQKSEETWKKIL